jgi:pyridoxine 4-dehydrogenase
VTRSFALTHSQTFTFLKTSTNVNRMGHGARRLAPAWPLQRAPNILLIPGTSSFKHLRENLQAGELKLNAEMIAELDLIGKEK